MIAILLFLFIWASCSLKISHPTITLTMKYFGFGGGNVYFSSINLGKDDENNAIQFWHSTSFKLRHTRPLSLSPKLSNSSIKCTWGCYRQFWLQICSVFLPGNSSWADNSSREANREEMNRDELTIGQLKLLPSEQTRVKRSPLISARAMLVCKTSLLICLFLWLICFRKTSCIKTEIPHPQKQVLMYWGSHGLHLAYAS